TGMNTLLHAPIQAAVQPAEWEDVDSAAQRTTRLDTTLIFSDENEMEMTASHTAVISRNQSSSQADNTQKIDITSFLMGLNSNSGKAETSNQFPLFSDHPQPSVEQKDDAVSVKKIDFNEFLMSLTSNEKTPNPAEGPEKENVFFVPSPVAEDTAPSSAQFVFPCEPLDTCNVTKIFKGHDDGMEMTTCQVPDVFSAIPGSVCSETVFRGDKTAGLSLCDDMEITGNYTDIIRKEQLGISADRQSSERQERTHPVKAVHKVLPTHSFSERDFSLGRRVSSAEGPQDSCSATALHSRGAREPLAADPSKPSKGSSQLPLFSEKSVVFPSGENMDLTESCGVMVPDHNIDPRLLERKAAPAYLAQGDNKTLKTGVATTTSSWEQPACDVSSLISGKMTSGLKPSPFAGEQTVVFSADAEMDITRSHTVSADNRILLQQ
ncbi:KNL1 protein, partial [Piaya cayana]|nr:KNL1 protein [Piaya cayana]